jgi:uncharacterized membrane protein
VNRPLASVGRVLLSGVLIVVPIYAAILLLLKGMASVVGVVKPVAALLPDSWPAETLLSLLFVLAVCFLVGLAVRTDAGRAVRERVERSLFERIPGYALVRSLTQQVAGQSTGSAWRPALVVIEEALVPAFIIEECDDRRYTVFVPSIPTPLAGAVYVLDRSRVYPVDVPFTVALKVISRWGSGAKDLVAAMEGPAARP